MPVRPKHRRSGSYRPAAHGQWFPYGDAPRHGGAPHERSELAQKLNLNSRLCVLDLNSLYNARLLLMESQEARNCYRTNLPVVRNMMERMLNYLQNQG